MAPRTGSRHSFALGVPDELGRRFLSEREPYRFKQHTDTRVHVVAQGDTLEGLAGRYFAPLPRASGFWWVVPTSSPTPSWTRPWSSTWAGASSCPASAC